MSVATAKEVTSGSKRAAQGEVSQWVTFRLGDEKYGINVVQVREVLRVTEIAPVPGAADFILGIINLRGNVVTVLDTRYRFGLPPRETDDATRIVIIESGDEVVGIMVDSVAEVLNVEASGIESAPNVGNDDSSRFIAGVTNQDDELVILIDHQRLMSAD